MCQNRHASRKIHALARMILSKGLEYSGYIVDFVPDYSGGPILDLHQVPYSSTHVDT